MAQETIKKEVIDKIRLFAQKAESKGIKIDSLILFGSYATGVAKPYSDIDLCIVSSQFDKDIINEASKLRLMADEVDWRIEPHPFHPADLNLRENPFAHEILATGVKII